ncbi:MAG TPA: hypothetical protein PL047_10010 [Methanothrix sp.]|nr:hypothetical protein [Methanothrix sp.]
MSGAISAIGSLFGGGALGTAIGTAAVGLGASQLVKSAMPSPSITVPEMKTPEVPSIVDISQGEVEATQQKRKKAAARTQTIYTTPLGLSGEAPTGKKTLLGG